MLEKKKPTRILFPIATANFKVNYLTAQRCHDYKHLIRRWSAVAKSTDTKLKLLTSADGFPIYYLEYFPTKVKGVQNKNTPNENGMGMYISAGIHGDEPAGPAALLYWAENRLHHWIETHSGPILILPCLNPWGLLQNRRTNASDIDLNRSFHQDKVQPVKALKQLLKGRYFKTALNLHEDYDAHGVYLYEVTKNRSSSLGNALIETARDMDFPIDNRKTIEGRKHNGGVIFRPRILRKRLQLPEAVYLFQNHCTNAITIETPSEFNIRERVLVQVRMIERCWEELKR